MNLNEKIWKIKGRLNIKIEQKAKNEELQHRKLQLYGTNGAVIETNGKGVTLRIKRHVSDWLSNFVRH